MKYVIDIDGVICSREKNYKDAKPNEGAINSFNTLYDAGNKIVYFTARGTDTRINWREVTEKQFKEWGVKCHSLIFEKPSADIYIDDKAFNPDKEIKYTTEIAMLKAEIYRLRNLK